MFWYLLGTYIMGFQAFLVGEDERWSWRGAIIFIFSPVVFPILLLILVAKLLTETLRSL